jgi:PleD family two-component response regulator
MISEGVAVYPEIGPTAQDLLRAADESLYRAKLEGRNHVELAD